MAGYVLGAYLLGMAIGLLAGAVLVGSLLDWLDKRIDAATTLPAPDDAATERIPPAPVHDLPRRSWWA